MTHDDYTRALSELQGAAGELVGLAIAGRKVDEALPQLHTTRKRASDLAVELRKRADVLDAAVATSHRVSGALNEA